MNLRNHWALYTEVFQTMVHLIPTYMKEIFEHSVSNKRSVRCISLHPKQTKLDIELRAWGALYQKLGIHCL